ncbi:MAG: amidase [Alicyclobacillus mali]|uniref:amidase n=1 Tax=Alicyclobacillus mali (ex Roth et al. 2021) TaxID=1123961 RepID=UPI0023F3BA2C|nr:amidase [Alicyclobacillus mali (ex Roth et al. 2021)]MCL6487366.1 amidase [Alicyclobacillus mali (ex Roth et al. 2021)]
MKEPWQPAVDDLVYEASVEQLQQAMADGRLTARDLTQYYLCRMAAYNQQGPDIHAVLEVNPDALHIAEALDVERAVRGPRGPLHGIPILLKDNIDTGDKMHTSAGSLALAESHARSDAHLVRRLREAGAVILGKTNLTEWANFMTENMPNGYSSRGGQVRNPYGPGRLDTGGSSAGSGAAIAANFAAAAIGTETSGSILSPSSQNSLVGIKPTVGLVSRSGIIPISISQDTAGPMTRSVRDAAVLLGAIAGWDEQDPATATALDRIPKDYTAFLDRDGLRGARLGVPRAFFERLDDDKRALMNAALDAMRELGAEVIDPVEIPNLSEIRSIDVMVYEFKVALNAYLQQVDPALGIHSLADVIRFNKEHAAACLRYGQVLLTRAEATSGTLTDAAYLTAKARDWHYSRTVGIDAVLQAHRLDALLFPANWGAALPAKAGYPSITVPAGYAATDGEPIGITFTAQAFSEPTLLRLAYAFEQATHHRKPPRFES